MRSVFLSNIIGGVSLSMPVPSLSLAISSVLLDYLNIMNGLESLDYHQHQIDTYKCECIKMSALDDEEQMKWGGKKSGNVEDTM